MNSIKGNESLDVLESIVMGNCPYVIIFLKECWGSIIFQTKHLFYVVNTNSSDDVHFWLDILPAV